MTAYLDVQGRRVDVDRLLLVGRSPDCTVHLDDARISRYHAVVVPTPVGCYLQDLGSSNGVLVNGTSYLARRLHDRDILTVGPCTLSFHDPAAPPPIDDIDDPCRATGSQTRCDPDPVTGAQQEATLRMLPQRRPLLRATTVQLETHEVATVEAERLTALGLLSAGVAHEIRNPLSVALGNVDLLSLRKELDPEARRFVAAVERSLGRIRAVSDALLGFSNRGSLRQRPFAPKESIDEAVAVIGTTGTVPKKLNVRVETRLPPDLPSVVGDPRWLTHVVVALLLDGAHALGPSGGGTITITACPIAGGVRLNVAGGGPPLTDDVRAKLFEPFFSRHGLEAPCLGLWTAHRIVESMDGSIDVTTADDGTALFVIELPAT